MSEGRIYNFAAGPSMLPLEVLKRAQSELLNYEGNGMSIMEMSHRSAAFQKVFDEAKAKFKEIMNVPDSHEVVFLQGGASSQFSAVPLNFLGDKGKATYAITGNFSNIAYKEAKKYGEIQVAYDGSDNGFRHIPAMDELDVDGNSTGVIITGPKKVTGTGMFNYCWPGCLTVMYDRNVIGLIQIEDIKKNNDYGSSVEDTYNKFGDVSYLVRITDKYNRILSLMNKEAEVNDESINDTILDMANYCCLWLASRKLSEDKIDI